MASPQKKLSSKVIGPGGIGCPCCGPAPGPTRKQLLRTIKRSEKQLAKKDIEQQLETLTNTNKEYDYELD